jgi:hypothetical protein
MAGMVFILTKDGGSRRLALRYSTDLPPDHDQAFDPDRVRALSFLDASALEVVLPHGETLTLQWDPASPAPGREPPYPNLVPALRDELAATARADEAALARRVEVSVLGAGVVGDFLVPGATGPVQAAHADLHPSGAFVALTFSTPQGGALHAGVFDTATGSLAFELPGALRMAWAVGSPSQRDTTSRDLAILTSDELLHWTLPRKQLSAHALELPGPPRTLDVSPKGSCVVVSALDLHTGRVTLLIRWLRGDDEHRLTPAPLTEGILASTFSPDGGTWVGFVRRDVTAEDDPSLLGELWWLEVDARELSQLPVRVTPDDGPEDPSAHVRLAFTSEEHVSLAVGRWGRVFDRRDSGDA